MKKSTNNSNSSKKKNIKKKKNSVINKKEIKKNILVDKENNKDVLKKIFKMFLITRIILVIFLIVAEVVLSNADISQYKHVFDLFDNEHYLNIANNGYTYMHEFAFFPLTPLLIRCLGKTGFLILNQVFVFLSGFLMYLISKDIYKKEDVYWPTIFFFISPISIFTCMFYSEALFIFLTILAFYLYKSKKNYFVLGITLGLSVLNRSLGSMLFFTIFIFMFINFIKKKEKFKNILITYIPATIISCLYPLYLYEKTGDLLYFANVQYEFWGRINTNIFTIFIDAFKLTLNNPALVHVLDYIVVFGLVIYIFYYVFKHRKDNKNYEMFVYVIFSILAICSTIRNNADAFASFYRYIFGCFPIYFMMKKNYATFILMILYTVFVTYFFLMGFYYF